MLFALLMLGVITAACALSDWYLTRQTETFTHLIEQAEQQTAQGHPEQALDTLKQLQAQWDRQAPLLGSLIRHAEMDEARLLLSRAQECLRIGQVEEYYLESDSLRCTLQQMDEMESLSWQNLF